MESPTSSGALGMFSRAGKGTTQQFSAFLARCDPGADAKKYREEARKLDEKRHTLTKSEAKVARELINMQAKSKAKAQQGVFNGPGKKTAQAQYNTTFDEGNKTSARIQEEMQEILNIRREERRFNRKAFLSSPAVVKIIDSLRDVKKKEPRKYLSPEELLQYPQIRQQVSSSFQAVSREQYEHATASKTNPPELGHYRPRHVFTESQITDTLFLPEHTQELKATQRIMDKHHEQHKICPNVLKHIANKPYVKPEEPAEKRPTTSKISAEGANSTIMSKPDSKNTTLQAPSLTKESIDRPSSRSRANLLVNKKKRKGKKSPTNNLTDKLSPEPKGKKPQADQSKNKDLQISSIAESKRRQSFNRVTSADGKSAVPSQRSTSQRLNAFSPLPSSRNGTSAAKEPIVKKRLNIVSDPGKFNKIYLPSGREAFSPTYADSKALLTKENPSRGLWAHEPVEYSCELRTDRYHIIKDKNNDCDIQIINNKPSPFEDFGKRVPNQLATMQHTGRKKPRFPTLNENRFNTIDKDPKVSTRVPRVPQVDLKKVTDRSPLYDRGEVMGCKFYDTTQKDNLLVRLDKSTPKFEKTNPILRPMFTGKVHIDYIDQHREGEFHSDSIPEAAGGPNGAFSYERLKPKIPSLVHHNDITSRDNVMLKETDRYVNNQLENGREFREIEHRHRLLKNRRRVEQTLARHNKLPYQGPSDKQRNAIMSHTTEDVSEF